MSHVAREAGVSAMTVSYTFNRPERVAEPTRRRVLEVAERLGYPGPDPSARSLRRGRTANLGVVLGEHLTYAFDDPQATQFLAGIATVCVEHGLGLTLIPITGGPRDAVRVQQAAVDAVVLWTTADDDPVLDAVVRRGLPAVVHGGPARQGVGLVAIDDRAAARAAGTAAFTAARSPAVLSFPLDRDRHPSVRYGPTADAVPFGVTRRRLQGYADAANDVGLDWTRLPVVVLARNDRAEAEAAALRLLQDDDADVDAIAAMSDELALGVLHACTAPRHRRSGPVGRQRLGRRRGGRVGGSDDHRPFPARTGRTLRPYGRRTRRRDHPVHTDVATGRPGKHPDDRRHRAMSRTSPRGVRTRR